MKFKIISCVNSVLAIGLNGDLIYKIKEDLANFKRMTLNSVIIMGRKTYESLPTHPLPYRTNIVITTDPTYTIPNGFVVHSIEECIKLCEEKFNDVDCYVIGGASIYEEFLKQDLIDYIYLTEVIDKTEGDTYFPHDIYSDIWRKFYQTPVLYNSDKTMRYTFTIYKKNSIK